MTGRYPQRADFEYVIMDKDRGLATNETILARKLVWHLLTKEEDFLYQKPKRTQDKRSNIRLLARRRTGRKTPSAEPPLAKRPALYGTGQ